MRARLLAISKQKGEEFELTLTRFAVERMLYRLSISSYADSFVLKGAMLFELWMGGAHRATRDADLLGLGNPDIESIRRIFAELCGIECDDAIFFSADSITVEETRTLQVQPGMRVFIGSILESARSRIQLDIGFGDAITPPPTYTEYPATLPDMRGPQIYVYPPETVFAEKLHVIAKLGIANSRMKDYYDLYEMIHKMELNYILLRAAIKNTFASRDTAVPAKLPVGLGTEFSADAVKERQWNAFLNRTRLVSVDLKTVVSEIADFVMSLLAEMDQN